MSVGETIPNQKRREQQRAREETQRYLDAGGTITELPYGASAEQTKANQEQRKPSKDAKPESLLSMTHAALKRLGKGSYIDVANETGMTKKQASNGLGNLVRTGRAVKTGEQVRTGPGDRYSPVYRAR